MDRHAWDERYRTEELIWRAEPNRFLVQEAGRLPAGRALDVACGEGRNALWLAARGWHVTGVDFSPVGLEKARRLALGRGLEVDLVEADLLEWCPPTASFDLVIVMYLHLPGPERANLLGRLAAALAPGGVLLVVGHDILNLTEGVGGPQDPAVLFSPEGIAGELAGLDVQRADRARRPVASEQGQRDAIDAIVRAVRQR